MLFIPTVCPDKKWKVNMITLPCFLSLPPPLVTCPYLLPHPLTLDPCLQHEDASVAMFKHMLKVNAGLMEAFKEAGLCDGDVTFIEEQIAGPKDTEGVGK